MPKGYIAGPMRGYPQFNFPAFDEAAARGRALGHTIISPAEMDRESGFQEDAQPTIDAGGIRKFVRRDADALLSLKAEEGDFIAFLPGWEKSTGAKAEAGVAVWLGLKTLDARSFKPMDVRVVTYSPTAFVPNPGAACFRPPDGVVRDDGTITVGRAMADGKL